MSVNVCPDMFWTTEYCVTKRGVMMQHYKPEYSVNNWITAVKIMVTAKAKMSMLVQMISSKPTNILLPNLVLWCIIMSQSVMQKGWFAIFKVKVTAKVYMIMTLFTISFELLILLVWNLAWKYVIISQCHCIRAYSYSSMSPPAHLLLVGMLRFMSFT